MKVFDYLEELEFIKGHIKEASAILKKPFHVSEKSVRDVVTSNDLAIETYLVEAIQSKYIGDAIISEENHPALKETKRAWVIDPIDGTTNYSRGIPLYGIQLAFVVDMFVCFSVIYIVPQDEMYVAMRGYGAFCNDVPISVGIESEIEKAIVSLGDFSVTNEFRNNRMLLLVRELMDKAYKLKIHGTACVDYTFVASAKTDVHIMSANHLWDYIPGLLLVHEAGGIVDQRLLGPIGDKRSLMVIASTRALYDLMIQYI